MTAAAEPIDAATIWRNCRATLPVFRHLTEAEAHELVLRGHVQLLLGDLPDPLTPGDARVVERARGFLATDCGQSLWTAYWHLEDLAMAGRLLLPIVLGDRAYPCHWCDRFTDTTRQVRHTDRRRLAPDGPRYACGPCREARRLAAREEPLRSQPVGCGGEAA